MATTTAKVYGVELDFGPVVAGLIADQMAGKQLDFNAILGKALAVALPKLPEILAARDRIEAERRKITVGDPPPTPLRPPIEDEVDDEVFAPRPASGQIASLDAHLGDIQFEGELFDDEQKRGVKTGTDAMNGGAKVWISCTPRDANGRELSPEDIVRLGIGVGAVRYAWQWHAVDRESGAMKLVEAGVWGWKSGPMLVDGALSYVGMAGKAYEASNGYRCRFAVARVPGRSALFCQAQVVLPDGTEIVSKQQGPWFVD